MNDKNLTHKSDRAIIDMYGNAQSVVLFYFALAAVIFLSYGYEIFNFNLTIDEVVHANHYVQPLTWISQGRWGMALLNLVVVQNTVVTVVSIFFGVIGLVIGVMLLLKNTFELDRVEMLSIIALAITVPTLPFTFTFSTFAYGLVFFRFRRWL